MRRRLSARALVLVLGLVAVAATGLSCSSEKPFTVVVQVSSDEGKALAGVRVKFGDGFVSETDEDGRVRRRVLGSEGTRLPVGVELPPGYVHAGSGRDVIVLRNLVGFEGAAQKTLPIEHAIRLVPTTRVYAVLVNVGVPGLPVEAFGQRRAITNRQGVAMFLYEGAPGESLAVRINTSSLPGLKPQHPGRTFQLGTKRQAFVLKESFTSRPVKIHRPGPRRVRRLF